MSLKRAFKRTLRALGFDGVHIGRYLLLMQVVGEPEEPRVGADPLESYLLERTLGDVLRRLEINCVLDVGGNMGQYGLVLRSIGYTGHIVSFEPVSTAFRTLRGIASHDPKWTAHQWALGAETTRATIHVTRGTAFSSILAPTAYSVRRFHASAPVESEETVAVHRLDEVLPSVIGHIERPRLFLKIDTQGYDLQVFAGAGGAVESMLGLQSEVAVIPLYEGAPTMLEALPTYQASGFDLSGLFPVTRDPDTASVLEYDCLMVRRGSFAAARVTPLGREARAGPAR